MSGEREEYLYHDDHREHWLLQELNRATDIFGKPFADCGELSGHEKWTTVLRFSSCEVLPASGFLQFEILLAPVDRQWAIAPRPVDEPCEDHSADVLNARVQYHDEHLTSVDESQVKTLMKSVFLDRNGVNWVQWMSKLCSATPFVRVHVEQILQPTACDFGGDIDAEQGLSWCSVADRQQTLQSSATSSTSRAASSSELDNNNAASTLDICTQSASTSNGTTTGSKKRPRDDDFVIGTAVSIYLNDSAVSPLNGVDERARCLRSRFRRQALSALCELHDVLKTWPLRCEPFDIATQPPIPLLTADHGVSLSLYDYQRRCVRYMLDVEQRARDERSACHVPVGSSIVFRHASALFVPCVHYGGEVRQISFHVQRTIENDRSRRPSMDLQSLDVCGGMLAARTGSGKTTVTIVAIYLQHMFDRHNVRRRPRIDKFDGPADWPGAVPSHRLPPRHTPMSFDDRMHYYTPATLVVAPPQVVQQWADEFRKTLIGKPLRVVTVRTVNDLKRITIDQLVKSIDVVVVNVRIFKSNTYRRAMQSDKNYTLACLRNLSRALVSVDRSKLSELVEQVQRGDKPVPKDPLVFGCVDDKVDVTLLHLLHFERVVIDEAHELDSAWTMVERAVARLRSNVTWLLTATANLQTASAFGDADRRRLHGSMSNNDVNDSLRGYSALIQARKGADVLPLSPALRWFFSRHNCITSAGAVGMPPLCLHRVDVLLTAREMAIYMSIAPTRRRLQVQFCSHHTAQDDLYCQDDGRPESAENLEQRLAPENAVSVEQASDLMQIERENRIQKLTRRVARLEQSIDEIQASALSTVVDASPLAMRVWQFSQQSLTILLGALQRKRYPVERVETIKSRLREESDDSEMADAEAVDDQQLTQRANVLRSEQKELNNRLSDAELSADDVFHDNRWRSSAATTIEELRESLRSPQSQLSAARDQLHAVRSEKVFFDSVFSRLQQLAASQRSGDDDDDASSSGGENGCPICLDSAAVRQTLVLTSCGHHFCADCATSHFSRNRRCPICRTALNASTDIRNIDIANVVAAAASSQCADGAADDASSTYGSKIEAMLALIGRLRQRSDFRKVIIYAQFDHLLGLIAKALDAFDLSYVYVRGSIAGCENALRKFKTDDNTRILLLSSEKTISGVHLVEANHLIAVHPPVGVSTEQEYGLFWQAIGRIRRLTQSKTCHVWSLVTRGTIESTLYDQQLQLARKMHVADAQIEWQANE